MADKFINLENFRKFLDENMKVDYYNFEACLDELVTRNGETGSCTYELGLAFTKSGKPECFYYETEEHFFIDGEEVFGDDIENFEDCYKVYTF